jgi:hypothetical protein
VAKHHRNRLTPHDMKLIALLLTAIEPTAKLIDALNHVIIHVRFLRQPNNN